jgi:hypothetical protein
MILGKAFSRECPTRIDDYATKLAGRPPLATAIWLEQFLFIVPNKIPFGFKEMSASV